MQDQRTAGVLGPALGPALVAAAATSGALVGFGLRLSAPALPFNAIGAVVLGPATLRATSFVPATILGVALHFATMYLWSAIHGALVRRVGGHSVLSAAGVGVAAFVAMQLIARLVGAGPAVILATGNQVVLCALLAIGLVIGMRLALSTV